MTRKEQRQKKKEIAKDNREFLKRLKPINAKRYRMSLLYEDALVHDDGKAYVNVDLTKIDSPFSVFSYNKRMDPEIFDYIDQQVFYLRVGIPVVINFDDGGKYSDAMKEKIRRFVKRHYVLEYEDKRLEHKKSLRFSFSILLLGIAILIAHFILVLGFKDAPTELFDELTLILSWMCIWQSTDSFLISGHTRRIDILNSGQLALAEVTFGQPKDN